MTGKTLRSAKKNQDYLIGDHIAKGGEGSIYSVVGYKEYVAKIYHNAPNQTLQRKLKYMLECKQPFGINCMAWPVDVVSENGKVLGYIMRRISGSTKNLEDMITSDKSFNDKLKLAYNISVLTYYMHDADHVIGDYNPKNVMVDSQTGISYLVDCDSFHITDRVRNYTYRCNVGMERYLAPELSKRLRQEKTDLISLRGESFTKETDLFALAIHIFSYLVVGRHPFDMALMSSATSSVTVPQTLDAIVEGKYIYAPRGLNIFRGLQIPPDAQKAYASLPDDIKQMFMRAFVDGHADPKKRPQPLEWCTLLEKHIKK